jgi:hypothetical protein
LLLSATPKPPTTVKRKLVAVVPVTTIGPTCAFTPSACTVAAAKGEVDEAATPTAPTAEPRDFGAEDNSDTSVAGG